MLCETHPVNRHLADPGVKLPFFGRQILKGVARYSLVSAIANSLLCFEIAGVFYAGGILIQNGTITMLQLMR